ncbi:glycerol-3-phosphate responsive antiterminator [Heliobacterium undosum]|uniref:Glycerol-3-phosphate responsive antiterminator n=1 Tax=Heliomicrobium undosum TaxID=121734 RepID=A0A845L5E8_9FIRM|nr:glycerol-3-phosphate responsive antiterminator [Heliomicrobium undosum]MZP30449.1 glycerol-3-phosphate responsive antiterminator [Heliomicrobium undosum]
MGFLETIMEGTKIGGALRRLEDLEELIGHPKIRTIFLLGGDVNQLPNAIKRIRVAQKNVLAHIDLIEGIGKDKAGIHLLKRMGVHGIVTTKSNLVKLTLDEGLWVVQRVFIVDSESIKTAIRVAGDVKPSAVEILPATVPRFVIHDLKKSLGVPVLAGGLLRSEADVRQAFEKGIDAVSTSLRHLWLCS